MSAKSHGGIKAHKVHVFLFCGISFFAEMSRDFYSVPSCCCQIKLTARRTINNMIIRCSIITCLCWCCYIRYITTATSLICVQKPMNEEKSSVRSWCWCWLTGDVRKLTVFTKSFYAVQRRNCSTIKSTARYMPVVVVVNQWRHRRVSQSANYDRYYWW